MRIVILGLSVTSSWGNGHATTYRSLIKGLSKRGHSVLFLERDTPWYSSNRDLAAPGFCELALYNSLDQLKKEHYLDVEKAEAVIVGSYVPEGIAVAEWVLDTARGIRIFYDIDTPVTITRLRNRRCEYLAPEQIPHFNIYLSFSAGQSLKVFEYEFGSPDARPFYCSVDPELYFPVPNEKKWDLGYLGTYSDDRQPGLEKLLIDASRKWEKGKFIVAGPQYPATIHWPHNIERIDHLAPATHNDFYNSQRYTLNITRQDMIKMGYSPSVRLFEAASCGVPIISDYWDGLETIFEPGKEILIAKNSDDTIRYLLKIPEKQRIEIGERARQKVLTKHTGEQRAVEFENYVSESHGKTFASRIFSIE